MRLQNAKSPKRGPGKAAKRKAALSAQQTIPYLVMHPDGVCQLPGGLYTKTVEYEDINYSVASTEDQTAIFSGWSSFLNYFSWQDIPKTGLGTKDYIAPDSFDFRQSRTFRIGQYWGAASYLQILASELSDKLLAEILELDAEMTVTLHIQTVDQLKAIKTIKGKLSDIGKMKVEE